MKRIPALCLAAIIGSLALAGCTSLLPKSKVETVSDWNNYDSAAKALAAIVPYQATRGDVHDKGLDPRRNPAVIVLHFADVLQRFSAAAMINADDVDRGIRDCLHAGMRCSGYAISVKKLAQNRVGNFWLDSFNFKRETVAKGWSVVALLVFVDDQLVYELVGGQPTINDYEIRRNPLGPLQSWGDLALPLLNR
jgi:outer membrane murein-binding lipoprotein Lpp